MWFYCDKLQIPYISFCISNRVTLRSKTKESTMRPRELKQTDRWSNGQTDKFSYKDGWIDQLDMSEFCILSRHNRTQSESFWRRQYERTNQQTP